MFGRSGNPVLGDKAVASTKTIAGYQVIDPSQQMTLSGTVNISAFLIVLTMAMAVVGWNFFNPALMTVCVFSGIGIVILSMFKKQWAPVLAPAYAIVEGYFFGAMPMVLATYSGYDKAFMTNVTLQAALATFSVFGSLLFLYKSGVIKPSARFKAIVSVLTMGVMVFYLAGFVASLIGFPQLWQFHAMTNTSMMSIGISLVVVALASMNLVIDFDQIATLSDRGLPKYMEWYAAFGLLVTMVWLYFEMFRLIMKIQSRD